jgi:MFS transporter, DHA2 family, glioxin efflux transporter
VKLPKVDAAVILATGATQIRETFSAAELPLIIDSYTIALKAVWAISTAAFGISAVLGIFGSWRKLHSKDVKEDTVGGSV